MVLESREIKGKDINIGVIPVDMPFLYTYTNTYM